mgnify:FL=1
MKLIKISSVWCPSCLIMNSRYNELVKKYNLDIEEYDYDMDIDVVEKYKIGDILPVVIVMDNKQELTRIIGEKSQKELNKIFEDIGV